ncbi:MAG TPA: GNAT family N-acetyltransferase [Tepidisphaeraceae bacterium]|jgi:ribosomal protein S18 acetylase RimI-like enzyme
MVAIAMEEQLDNQVAIRSFRPEDQAQCKKLYVEGLLGGKLAENDTGLDIDDIDTTYMRIPGNHFWVVEGKAADVVGMIGVQHHEQNVGEIRRLRVRGDMRRRGIGTRLVETALKFCQDHNYLKITLDTFMDREPAIKLFEKFRFRHERTRSVGGKDLLYFYLDIYGQEKKA